MFGVVADRQGSQDLKLPQDLTMAEWFHPTLTRYSAFTSAYMCWAVPPEELQLLGPPPCSWRTWSPWPRRSRSRGHRDLTWFRGKLISTASAQGLLRRILQHGAQVVAVARETSQMRPGSP